MTKITEVASGRIKAFYMWDFETIFLAVIQIIFLQFIQYSVVSNDVGEFGLGTSRLAVCGDEDLKQSEEMGLVGQKFLRRKQ